MPVKRACGVPLDAASTRAVWKVERVVWGHFYFSTFGGLALVHLIIQHTQDEWTTSKVTHVQHRHHNVLYQTHTNQGHLSKSVLSLNRMYLAQYNTSHFYLWPSSSLNGPVYLSVCLSVTPYFTIFLSFYLRSNDHSKKWCPCKKSRSGIKGQGHRGQNKFCPTLGISWL